MIIFPAIDLKDGQCVRLKKGVMDDATLLKGLDLIDEAIGETSKELGYT